MFSGGIIGETPKWRLHLLIHTFGSRKDTTTCGGGSERARVWIKVCNVNFPNKKAESLLTLPLMFVKMVLKIRY